MNRSLKRLVGAYLESGASQYSGMLAFSLFVAILPLATGVLTVLGYMSQNPRRFAMVVQLVIDAFPPGDKGAMRLALQSAGQHPGLVGLLSVAALLWFSTGLFSTTGFILNRVYAQGDRSFWRQRLHGLWMPVALTGAAAVAITANLIVRQRSLPLWVGAIFVWLAVSYVIFFLYRLAPSRVPKRAEIWPGALLAGAAVVALSYLLPDIARLTAQFSPETRFFTATLGLMAWLYCIAQAILIGAVLNRFLRRPDQAMFGGRTG